MQMQGLEGIKVLELAGHIAGACCAKLLAGFGAEVTRVEAQCPAPRTPEERAWLDTGKRLWNAKAPATADAELRALPSTADIITDAWPIGSLERRGVDISALAATAVICDSKSVVAGTRVEVREGPCGRRILKKKK